MLVRIDK